MTSIGPSNAKDYESWSAEVGGQLRNRSGESLVGRHDCCAQVLCGRNHELTQKVQRSLRFAWPTSGDHPYREQERLA